MAWTRQGRGRGNFLSHDLTGLLVRLLINVFAILVASAVIPGIRVDGWLTAIIAGAIFGLVNAFIKPIVHGLTCPLYLLTLGLFALVVNALMLWLASVLATALGFGFSVDGVAAAFFGAILISIVSWVASLLI